MSPSTPAAQAPPTAAPRPLAPAHGASVDADSADFSWSPVDGAEGYTLQVATDADFTEVIHEVPVGAASHVTLYRSLPDGASLHWRVRAEGGAWSPTEAFSAVDAEAYEAYRMEQAYRASDAEYGERIRAAEAQAAEDRIPVVESDAMGKGEVMFYLTGFVLSFLVLLFVLFVMGQVVFPAEASLQ